MLGVGEGERKQLHGKERERETVTRGSVELSGQIKSLFLMEADSKRDPHLRGCRDAT